MLMLGGARAAAMLFGASILGTGGPSWASDPAPLSDPSNGSGWVLNHLVSDEFDGEDIDHDKWNVQGRGGGFNGWKGRAPSQFVAENVRVEGGKLKIRSKWDPDYDFVGESQGGVRYGDPVAPVTTGGVIGNRRFLYGYMEVRSKAADAAMTSAFWTLGHESELDIYEQMGRPKKSDGGIEVDTLNAAIHDWRPGKFSTGGVPLNKVFNFKHDLGFRVADDFHVYGVEWDPAYLRFYVDGKFIREATRAEIGDGWVLTNPLQLYFDSEIFSWLGYPHAAELPADYEVDYVRVWQKPDTERLDRAFYGFEGPLFTLGRKPPGASEKVRNKEEWRQDWYFDGAAAKHFAIVENEQYLGGKRSLRLVADKAPKGRLTAFAPPGSVVSDAGEQDFSVRVYVPTGPGRAVVQFFLDEPWYQSPPIDLSRFPRDQWVNLPIRIPRNAASGPNDRVRIMLVNEDGRASGTYYFDDVSLVPAEEAE